MSRFKVLFASGLILLLPVAVTLYLLAFVFRFADNIAGRFLYPYMPVPIPGLGLLLTLAIVLLFGLLGTNILGRTLIRAAEAVIMRTPIVKNVYGTMKQLVETIALNKRGAFKQVALIEYPRSGLYSYVFVTATGYAEAERLTGERLVSVFLPTTPNPTSGYLLLVPEQDLIVLKMSVEEGIKTVISAGVVVSQVSGDHECGRIEAAGGRDDGRSGG